MTRTKIIRLSVIAATIPLMLLLAVPMFWAINLTPQYPFSGWVDLLALIAWGFTGLGVYTATAWVLRKVSA